MAKSATPKNKAKKPASQQNASRKRAASPVEKSARRQPARTESSTRAPLLDDNAHRNIIGIVCAVVALVLILIVAWPTNAVVTSFLSLWMRKILGIGAYLLPIFLIIVAGVFIARFDSERVPTRVIIGLVIIFVALLVMTSLFTPNALENVDGIPFIFNEKEIIYRGGYMGAGPAWAGLTFLGLPVSFVIALGIFAIGLVVVGFSVRGLVGAITARRIEQEELEDELLSVAPDMPYVPATPGRNRQRVPVDSGAKTMAIGAQPDANATQALVRDSGRIDPSTKDAPTQQLTRKLGKKKRKAEDEPKGESKPVEQQRLPLNDSDFQLPSMSLLKTSKNKKRTKAGEDELAETAARLQQTMIDFGIMSQGITAQVVDWIAGPTVTLFEIDLPPGVRVSRLTALNDDIALALAAPGVRIFAPIPGTHYVGIEVPNSSRDDVLLGDVIKDVHGGPLEVAIGKDVEGNAIIEDLAKMPHLLIGGTTGSGKSVGINAMIMTILMRTTPDEVRFIMIKPKRVEFAHYDGIPHLYVPVVTEPKEAASALSWGVAEMELRLKTYSKVGAKNISSYNEMVASGKLRQMIDEGTLKETDIPQSQYIDERMPYIVIVIDELADLMMNVGKEVEFSISRIAQLARAAGIHLIVATQRPSANVVTGLIKANITTRIAFNVASGLDSRVILDTSGAESLIGRGDLLLSKPELGKPLRVQGCFTSDEEIEAVVQAVKSQGEPEYHSEILKTNLISLGDTQPDGSGGSASGDDPLIWEAAEIVVSSGLGSTSNIQRKLKVGYSRAGRIMDMLEEKGVVGPPNGSKPRDVLVDAMELETLRAFEENDGA